ncbi:MAG TPA: DUF4097 family beta strand repeat-containing protein [Pyrinomonadaceae bacterium]|nr:DUF4097 family beta strand repeat-containing protein [Pyrinomonadaceae bacterium]
MPSKRVIIMWAVLAAVVALAAAGWVAPASSAQTREETRPELREEFHQTYPLSPTGRVALENINGSVRIQGWDRNEVKVDAVKRAYTPERLAEAEIRVDATADSVRVKTKYPEYKQMNFHGDERRYNNPAAVDYVLTVPRTARVEGVALINGSLDIEGVTGEVNASSINGRVTARGLTGRTKLSTVNGMTEAVFERLGQPGTIELASVNGVVQLTLPSDAEAELRANTVHGGISTDFELPVRRGRFVGHDLAGRLGRGGTLIRLSNVNGQIRVKRAADGRTPSGVTNLLSEAGKEGDWEEVEVDENEISREVSKEVARELAEAKLETDAAREEIKREVTREVQREMRDKEREIQRQARQAVREQARETREAAREASRNMAEGYDETRVFDQQSKTFQTSGAPRLSVQTFDGHVTVRAWDKNEVMYTAHKRAHDEREMRGVTVRAEQAGQEITLAAGFDKSFAGDVQREGNRVVSFSSGASVNFEVFVPRNASVRAASADGRLSVEGVSGEVNLITGDGSIDVSGGRGRLHVQTGDGRINVTGYEGEVEARAGDGRIALDGRFVRLTAQTGAGSIQLSLPRDLNALIETDSESVINDGLASEEGGETPVEGRRVRRWRVGRGGEPTFTLRTGDGRIVLRPR